MCCVFFFFFTPIKLNCINNLQLIYKWLVNIYTLNLIGNNQTFVTPLMFKYFSMLKGIKYLSYDL